MSLDVTSYLVRQLRADAVLTASPLSMTAASIGFQVEDVHAADPQLAVVDMGGPDGAVASQARVSMVVTSSSKSSCYAVHARLYDLFHGSEGFQLGVDPTLLYCVSALRDGRPFVSRPGLKEPWEAQAFFSFIIGN